MKSTARENVKDGNCIERRGQKEVETEAQAKKELEKATQEAPGEQAEGLYTRIEIWAF